MRRRVVGGSVVVLALAALAAPAGAFSFEDVQLWAGEGSNEAVVALEWSHVDPPLALAWGYRWNGTATIQDALVALAGTTQVRDGTFEIGGVAQGNNGPIVQTLSGADRRLGLQLTDWGWGTTVFGIGYDVDNDGGFEYVYGLDETGHAADGDDVYYEGWLGGFWWGIGVGDGSDWTASDIGLEEALSADGWYGTSTVPLTAPYPPPPEYFPDYDGLEPAPGVAPVPEPATLVLVGLALAAVPARMRRRRT